MASIYESMSDDQKQEHILKTAIDAQKGFTVNKFADSVEGNMPPVRVLVNDLERDLENVLTRMANLDSRINQNLDPILSQSDDAEPAQPKQKDMGSRISPLGECLRIMLIKVEGIDAWISNIHGTLDRLEI